MNDARETQKNLQHHNAQFEREFKENKKLVQTSLDAEMKEQNIPGSMMHCADTFYCVSNG